MLYIPTALSLALVAINVFLTIRYIRKNDYKSALINLGITLIWVAATLLSLINMLIISNPKTIDIIIR